MSSFEEPQSLFDAKWGFHFRQRKGSPNLRRLDSIDVERLVREVDVETLQQNIEDITFCSLDEDLCHYLSDRQVVNLFRIAQLTIEYLLFSQSKLVESMANMSHRYAEKKRSLQRKRREFMALKEEAQGLQSQLKLKRQNIRSLEQNIKDALQHKTKIESLSQPLKSPTTDICLFVAIPNGSFLELPLSLSTSIQTLEDTVCAMLKGTSQIDLNANSIFRFFYKGKLLSTKLKLADYQLQDSDTVVLSIITPQIEVIAPVEEKRPDPLSSCLSNQIVDDLRAEIRNWKQHIESGTQSRPQQEPERSLINDISSRLKGIETSIHDLSTAPTPAPAQIHFGPIENDNDDINESLRLISKKVDESLNKVEGLNSQIGSLRSLRDAIADQHIQLEELRGIVGKPIIVEKTREIIREEKVPVHSTVPDTIQIVKRAKQPLTTLKPSRVDPTANKWNNLLTSSDDKPQSRVLEDQQLYPQHSTVIDTPETLVDSKPLDDLSYGKVAPNIQPIKSPVVETVHEEIIPISQSVQLPLSNFQCTEQSVAPVQKQFSTRLLEFDQSDNTCLQSRNLPNLVVDISTAVDTESIIVAIRRALSSHAKVPFSRTFVLLNDRKIKQCSDLEALDSELLSSSAELLTRTRKCQLGIENAFITASQLDILHPLHHSKHLKSHPDEAQFDSLRSSLGDMMVGLGSDGLSDSEFKVKKNEMDEMLRTSRIDFDPRKSRLGLAKTVSYVTSESDSDWGEVTNRGQKPRIGVDDLVGSTYDRRRGWQSIESNYYGSVDQRSSGGNVPVNDSGDSPFDEFGGLNSDEHSLALSDSNNFND